MKHVEGSVHAFVEIGGRRCVLMYCMDILYGRRTDRLHWHNVVHRHCADCCTALAILGGYQHGRVTQQDCKWVLVNSVAGW